MKAGDIFYSVMQKDNCPFEKPRITKFVFEKFDTAHSYPIVSTKTDKWGRHYAFRESQIHLTYEDALVEKKKIIEKIEKWEEERREQDRLYFEEQERKEKQRQLEHDNQVKKQVFDEIKSKIVYYAVSVLDEAGNVKENVWGISKKDIDKILDQIQGESK